MSSFALESMSPCVLPPWRAPCYPLLTAAPQGHTSEYDIMLFQLYDPLLNESTLNKLNYKIYKNYFYVF